jgi:hypothetical protein
MKRYNKTLHINNLNKFINNMKKKNHNKMGESMPIENAGIRPNNANQVNPGEMVCGVGKETNIYATRNENESGTSSQEHLDLVKNNEVCLKQEDANRLKKTNLGNCDDECCKYSNPIDKYHLMMDTGELKENNNVDSSRKHAKMKVLSNKVTLEEANQLEELFNKKRTMCGIGIGKVMDFLNRKSCAGDQAAKILQMALKLEEERISSIICEETRLRNNLDKVRRSFDKLIRVIRQSGTGDYGHIASHYTVFGTCSPFLVPFCIDLPGDEQINFAAPITYRDHCKRYEKEQKKSDKTNLARIENAINKLYNGEMLEKHETSTEKSNIALPNITIEKHIQDDFAIVYKFVEVQVLDKKSKVNMTNNNEVSSPKKHKLTREDYINGKAVIGKCHLQNVISLEDVSQFKELCDKRASMCGIGTKRLKNFLNRKAKEGDKAAEILYVALNVEDGRIMSRLYDAKFRVKRINIVDNDLDKLIHLIAESGIGDYGYIEPPYCSFAITQAHEETICIELPGDEQIGFVYRMYRDHDGLYKSYNKKLKQCGRTNLTKIEEAINKLYGDQIIKKYGTSAEDKNVKLPNVVIGIEDEKANVFKLEYFPKY